jgi:hypothetical protein
MVVQRWFANGDYLTNRANPLEKSGAVDVRERQALLGNLDSQHTERRRRACAGSCGQSFHCFRYWRTAALSGKRDAS